jgi:Asp-tRNA(Asn)/Glu-tRNA(Gln) amidotransferase A subunit family amidase
MKENFEEFINNSKLNITEITLPESFDNALQNHEIIMNGGIYSSLKKVYKEDKENLHPYTINRIENGLNLNASDYVDAIENAKKMKFDLSTIFEKFDAIITPAAPGEAPRDLSTTGNAMFNGYWTMMGVPAISLPLLTGENSLPIGVQVITSWQNDNLLLKISDEILKDYQ